MQFSIDDSVLLKVSGVAAAACGAWALAAPRHYHEFVHTSTASYGEPATRYAGLVGAWLGSEQLVLSARSDLTTREAKKDALKVAGVGWLAAAATHMYNVQNNLAQRDAGTAIAVGEAVLGALCLYRGFEDKLD